MNKQSSQDKRLSRRELLKIISASSAAGLISMGWLGSLAENNQSNSLQPTFDQINSSNSHIHSSSIPQNHLAPGERPNILFILGDNHNAKTMGCAGHPFIQTSGMDRLAREGLRFENTFNTTSLCSASRASILTGAYAHKHGVLNNHTAWTGQMTTFLELLSRAGYATAFIGKWHMPGEGLPDMPFLDRYISYTYREGQGSYFNCPMIVDGEEVPSRTPYITAEVTNYAIEFIEEIQAEPEEERQPFFVYLSHRPGHPPFQSPDELKGIYDNQDVKQVLPPHVDPWWYGKANDNVFQGVMLGSYYNQYRRYCETLTAMDKDIERILDKLDELGLRKNTVVIYMGDNGMQWGTHDCHGIREAYEESIQLPFIIRAPWIIPDAGEVRSQIALNIDLAPTFLELAGESVPAEMDGKSLLPYLYDPLAEGREDFLLEYWRYYPENTPSYIGIRTQRYKYVEFERGRKPWLFDLQEDPGEIVNLFGTKFADSLTPKLKARIIELQG